MSDDVVDVHRQHLGGHRLLTEYNSGYEYLRDEVGWPEADIADEYRSISMKHMYRIHTGSPRQFLIVQKNPDLKPGWVSETLHGPHAHLNEWEADTLKRNVAHSRTTVTGYLEESGLRLKLLMQAIVDVFDDSDLGIDSPLDQEAFEQYLHTDINDEYHNNASDPVISSDAGFFGDFAYTNAMKNQSPTEATTWGEDDREWLQDEIAAVNPDVILALGNGARDALRDVGFERIDYDGPLIKDEGGILTYAGEDSRLQGMDALRLYHLGARDRPPHEIMHESLQTIKERQ